MDKEVIWARLQKYIEAKSYIQLTQADGNFHACIPLAASQQLLMVLRFYDFEPYGYEILPLDSIRTIRRSNSDVFFGRIVKQEGAFAWIDASPDIDLRSWRSVFSFFLGSGENITVDIGKEDCVNVGRVTGADDTTLNMRCFSATGVWDDTDWAEPYHNIAGLEFRNHYLQVFTKYLPPIPQ